MKEIRRLTRCFSCKTPVEERGYPDFDGDEYATTRSVSRSLGVEAIMLLADIYQEADCKLDAFAKADVEQLLMEVVSLLEDEEDLRNARRALDEEGRVPWKEVKKALDL